MTDDDLLAELREWRGNVDDIVIDDREVTLSLLDFAAFITKRERAAERKAYDTVRFELRVNEPGGERGAIAKWLTRKLSELKDTE